MLRILRNTFGIILLSFLTKNDLSAFLNRIEIIYSVYLYHLSIPLSLRKQRLYNRGPSSLIDLEKDQKDRDEVKVWLGYVYENVNSPEEDSLNLYRLIQNEKGLIGLSFTVLKAKLKLKKMTLHYIRRVVGHGLAGEDLHL